MIAVKAGITREEVALVDAYIRRELRVNVRTPFNDNSRLWSVLARDNWKLFEERLHTAQQARKRGWRPFPQERPANVVPLPVPQEDAEIERVRRAGVEQLKQWRQQL